MARAPSFSGVIDPLWLRGLSGERYKMAQISMAPSAAGVSGRRSKTADPTFRPRPERSEGSRGAALRRREILRFVLDELQSSFSSSRGRKAPPKVHRGDPWGGAS